MNRYACLVGATLLALLGPGGTAAEAQLVLSSGIEPAEPVRTVTVRLDVGEGDDLQEPVALDLGLGFPFWLHPVGRAPGQIAPFGAVPHESTAAASIPAGSSATFTFSAEHVPGLDPLQSSSQLLAGVEISDIGRIGFAGRGTSRWMLAGYEIQINGRAFASHDGVNLCPADVLESARSELAEVRAAIEPLEAERDRLLALPEAELATEEHAARLDEIERERWPLLARRQRLAGQIAGPYPWFEEPDFQPAWRLAAAIGSARVTLVTYDHTGADTRNAVYFRTGGHKYLLNPSAGQLLGAYGPQQFELDLIAGPLTAADIRGYAVGMIGQNRPAGDAPDRWHPQRIVVELDGRVVYDSEASPIDHESLSAIRLIPPAHLDAAGALVANLPSVRETFLWEAGMGAGLDLAGGGMLPLPEDAALWPDPEPGLAGMDIGVFDPGFGLFPGESWTPYGSSGWMGDWCPGWDDGWGTPPPWFDLVLNLLGHDADPFPDSGDPPPAGDSFQIDNVRIISGWQTGDTFNVQWAVSGDEGAIDHYTISLLPVYPDRDMPFGASLATATAAAGTCSVELTLPAVMVADPFYYLAPVVVADPSDPADTAHERIGPAVAVFPSGTSPLGQPQLENTFVCVHPPFLMPSIGAVSFGGEPAGSDRAVWTIGGVESHNAILFDTASPAWNIGVRPEAGDRMTITLVRPALAGRHRVVAHVGFLHGPEAANEVEVRMTCRLEPDGGGPPTHDYPAVASGTLVNPAAGPVVPMRLIEQEVNAGDATWAGNANLVVTFTFEGGAVDAGHPPALFGARLVPLP